LCDRGASSERSGEAPECLRSALERARRLLAGAIAESAGLVGIGEGVERHLAGGKALRPALSIWFGAELGVGPAQAEAWGLAVELLHAAFLIQDDIQDGDRLRRGRPTLWVEFGVPVALDVAGFLVAEAYRRIAAIDAPPSRVLGLVADFAATHRTTVEGQALDLAHRADPGFTLERYESIIRRKTGRTLALAWVGPARLAGWNEEQLELLWRIGDELGPAFQIKDDLLDLTEGKGRGEVGCDIREGKPSILVAHALGAAALDPPRRERLLAVLAREREATTAAEVAWVIALFEELGSRRHAEAEAQRRAAAARAIYPLLPGSTERRVENLARIAAYIVDRKV
jgi:geranylgeranyl pyrophosphate synthase